MILFPSRRAGDFNALAHPLASLQLLRVLVCKRASERYIAAARWLTPSWKRRWQQRDAAQNLIDRDASRRSDVNSRQRDATQEISAVGVCVRQARIGTAAFLNRHRINAPRQIAPQVEAFILSVQNIASITKHRLPQKWFILLNTHTRIICFCIFHINVYSYIHNNKNVAHIKLLRSS